MANKYGNIIKLDETPAAITPAAGVQNIYGKADGLLYAKNSTGQEYLLNNALSYTNTLTTVFPAAAQANTTRVPVTGWSFPVTAGRNYKIQVIAGYTTAIATTGGSLGLTLTTAVGSINGYMDATIVNTGAATNLRQSIYAVTAVNGAAGSFLTSTGMTLGGIGSFVFESIFICTTTGTFNILWGTEVAGSLAQLRVGSTLIATQIN